MLVFGWTYRFCCCCFLFIIYNYAKHLEDIVQPFYGVNRNHYIEYINMITIVCASNFEIRISWSLSPSLSLSLAHSHLQSLSILCSLGDSPMCACVCACVSNSLGFFKHLCTHSRLRLPSSTRFTTTVPPFLSLSLSICAAMCRTMMRTPMAPSSRSPS